MLSKMIHTYTTSSQNGSFQCILNGCYPISHFVPAADRSRLMNNKRKFHKKKERKKTRKKEEKRMKKE